jgi:7-carboxy-7-deazaguanine synthase
MLITEIYRSIQGESSYTGRSCVFVRLTGCNLRCSWCDSVYTFTGGNRMSVDEVMEQVRALEPVVESPTLAARTWGTVRSSQTERRLVEITGGEPMLQEREVVPLMERLLAEGYSVLLETSGERPLEKVPAEVIKIVDVKCPASGEGGTFQMENLNALKHHDEIKFVIASREDYEFARDFSGQHNLPKCVANVIFSPAFRQDASGTRDSSHCMVDPRELVEWILVDKLQVRLGLQVHKFVWDPATKSV